MSPAVGRAFLVVIKIAVTLLKLLISRVSHGSFIQVEKQNVVRLSLIHI